MEKDQARICPATFFGSKVRHDKQTLERTKRDTWRYPKRQRPEFG